VAPGTTRKLWYDEALSVPVSSITSPGEGRHLWLDPRLVPDLAGRRVLLVDDVISTGSSILAGLALLERAGVAPVAIGAAMLQGDRWRARLPGDIPVLAAFATPIFSRAPEGWQAIPGTAPEAFCV
jgi:adenine/guanine phosphoribosyltransferase-like PRPP-binding protein